MAKINRARADFKHHGLSFLDDACSLCFGIFFDEASLLDLIKHDEVRELLKSAETELSAGKLAEVFVSVGKALACGFATGWRSKLHRGFSASTLGSAAPDRLARAITVDRVRQL
jgi:hypothetical protein